MKGVQDQTDPILQLLEFLQALLPSETTIVSEPIINQLFLQPKLVSWVLHWVQQFLCIIGCDLYSSHLAVVM